MFQLKRIGDLILTTPAIRCLREAFPDARLTLVADSSCAGLLGAISVDERWVYRKGEGLAGLARRGPNAWLGRDLLGFRADWALDFTGTDRAGYLSALSLSGRRATFQRFKRKPFRKWIYTDFVDSSVGGRHTADHYLDLLRPLGIARQGVPLDLHLRAEDFSAARALLESAGVDGNYVVVHAGTARREKYWRPERWAEVVGFLHEKFGFTSVLTGSADAVERQDISGILSKVRCPCVDLSGRTGLPELAALIKGARLLCGVDTAAVHLADAVRTPSLALFGPTNPYHWCPRHSRSVILRAGTKPPFTPEQKGAPMDEISVTAVLAALRELLD